MTEDERLEAALDLAERLTKYTFHRSMRQLRARIKSVLKERGLADQLRNFKLKGNGDSVTVLIRKPKSI